MPYPRLPPGASQGHRYRDPNRLGRGLLSSRQDTQRLIEVNSVASDRYIDTTNRESSWIDRGSEQVGRLVEA